MPDNSFEQNLNRQMKDFNYPASDAVWQKLEVNLQKKKKRRWAIIWFLGGLLLVSTGIYFFARPATTGVDMNISSNSRKTDRTEKPLVNPGKSSTYKVNEGNNIELYAQTNAEDIALENIDTVEETKKRKYAKSNLSVPDIANSGKNYQDREKVNEKSSEKIKQTENDKFSTNDIVKVSNIKKIIREDKKEEVPPVLISSSNPESNNIKKISGNPVADSVSVINVLHTQKQSDSLVIGKNDQKVATYNRRLLFGLRIEAGRSAKSELNFAKTKSADMVSSPSAGGPQANAYPFKQEPSFAWSFGAWVRKPLSQKVNMQTGLTYHHYRTRATQGDSSNYANTYHLLSVPIELALQLNKGKKLPVRWHFGIEPGWMVGSNAIVQDTSGYLYSDKSQINRFQIGIQTGISFRLFQKSPYPLELGPVFKYMLTPAFKSGSGDDGHLNFLGLRADWKIFQIKSK